MKRTPFRSELLGTGVEAHIAKFEKKGAMRKVVRTVVRAPGGGRRLRVVDSPSARPHLWSVRLRSPVGKMRPKQSRMRRDVNR